MYSKQRLVRNSFFSPKDANPQILWLIPLSQIRFLGPPVLNLQIHNFLLLIHKLQIRIFHRCASPLIAYPRKLGFASRKRIGSANRKKTGSAKRESKNCHICGRSPHLRNFYKFTNLRICNFLNFADRPPLIISEKVIRE